MEGMISVRSGYILTAQLIQAVYTCQNSWTFALSSDSHNLRTEQLTDSADPLQTSHRREEEAFELVEPSGIALEPKHSLPFTLLAYCIEIDLILSGSHQSEQKL